MLQNSPVQIGGRLRTLRRQQQRTLEEVAEAAGVTKSMLSKVETGKASPAIATLANLAAALGTDLAHLLSEGSSNGPVFMRTASAGPGEWTSTDKGYRFLALASQRHHKRMTVFLFEARRGQVRPRPMSHRGEEFIFVLHGQMRYTVGTVQHLLGPGDGLYFDAEQDHDLEPVTTKVSYLAVFVDRADAAPVRRSTHNRRNAK